LPYEIVASIGGGGLSVERVRPDADLRAAVPDRGRRALDNLDERRHRPLWARSGQELFYLDGAGAMIRVPIQTAPTFSAGTPTKLFDTRYHAGAGGRPYDISPDGQLAGGVEGAPAGEVAARLPVPGLAEGKGSRSFDPVHPYNQRRVALTPGTRLGTSMNVIIESSGCLVIWERRC
jgi:hypothetical protein